jgi:hypothetical protein
MFDVSGFIRGGEQRSLYCDFSCGRYCCHLKTDLCSKMLMIQLHVQSLGRVTSKVRCAMRAFPTATVEIARVLDCGHRHLPPPHLRHPEAPTITMVALLPPLSSIAPPAGRLAPALCPHTSSSSISTAGFVLSLRPLELTRRAVAASRLRSRLPMDGVRWRAGTLSARLLPATKSYRAQQRRGGQANENTH